MIWWVFPLFLSTSTLCKRPGSQVGKRNCRQFQLRHVFFWGHNLVYLGFDDVFLLHYASRITTHTAESTNIVLKIHVQWPPQKFNDSTINWWCDTVSPTRSCLKTIQISICMSHEKTSISYYEIRVGSFRDSHSSCDFIMAMIKGSMEISLT